MNLSTLRQEVRERIGELEEDFFSDDEVDRAINEAVRRFSAEEPWPWLYTEWTSALDGDDNSLDLPSNISLNRIFNMSVSGGSLAQPRLLERLEPKAGFRARFIYDQRTGPPRWYYIAASNQDDDGAPPVTYTARVIPTPDDDYDVEAQYLAVPAELSGDADEPQVPDEYQEAIIAWAVGKLFLKEFSISQKASEQFSIYAKVLDQAREDTLALHQDEDVAWGREAPMRRYRSRHEYVMDRIPPSGLGQ